LLVLTFALAWIAAAGDVHAAKKDTSMCDGLKGAAKGFCTAAAALGCGAPTKHQKQCDALGDKFETLTGQLPPWEKPVDPPPPPPPVLTLMYDTDAFDLEAGTLCEDALGAPCNMGETGFFQSPNDFTMSLDVQYPNEAIFVPVLACVPPVNNVGVAFLAGTPFAAVDSSILGMVEFLENVLEVPFDAGDTIVLRTCEGNFFKIGNVVIGPDGATFAYERL
jgi:hypothetical protein